MEPQNNQTSQEPQTGVPAPSQPAQFTPIYQPPTHSQKGKKAFLLSLLIALLVGVGVGGYFAYNAYQTEKEQARAAQAEKEAKEKELAAAQAKIQALDNPQAKANDVKRKNDLARFAAAANEYAANNRGEFPSTEPSFFKKDFSDKYLSAAQVADFSDPNTKERYTFTPVAKVQTPPGLTLGDIQYQWPGECAGSEFKDASSDRKAAARILLESGQTYCLDI